MTNVFSGSAPMPTSVGGQRSAQVAASIPRARVGDIVLFTQLPGSDPDLWARTTITGDNVGITTVINESLVDKIPPAGTILIEARQLP